MAKYYNISFPIKDDLENNRLFAMNKTVRNGVRSELLLLLMCNKGERWYSPEYGTNLRKYLFEPNDNVTRELIHNEIVGAVKTFLPRLTIANIALNQSEHQIIIDISFTYTQGYYTLSDVLTVKITA